MTQFSSETKENIAELCRENKLRELVSFDRVSAETTDRTVIMIF